MAALLVLLTTARPAFMVLLGALFLLRIPYLYWSMRSRYIENFRVDGFSMTPTLIDGQHLIANKLVFSRLSSDALTGLVPFVPDSGDDNLGIRVGRVRHRSRVGELLAF